MNDRAGITAQASDLIDVNELVAAYYALVPDVSIPEQRVVFGTSGHRGSSLDTAFNEVHIAARSTTSSPATTPTPTATESSPPTAAS